VAEAAIGGTPLQASGPRSPASPTDVVAAAGDPAQRMAEMAKTIGQINTRLAALEGDKTLSTRIDEVSGKLQTQGDQITSLASLKASFDGLDARLSHIEQSDLMTMARRAALSRRSPI